RALRAGARGVRLRGGDHALGIARGGLGGVDIAFAQALRGVARGARGGIERRRRGLAVAALAAQLLGLRGERVGDRLLLRREVLGAAGSGRLLGVGLLLIRRACGAAGRLLGVGVRRRLARGGSGGLLGVGLLLIDRARGAAG